MENRRLEQFSQEDNASLSAVKFFLSNSNVSIATDSSKFTIPTLKTKSSSSNCSLKVESCTELGSRPSNINEFLLKQFEPQNSNDKCFADRFNVPKLKGSTSGFSGFIPELKNGQRTKEPPIDGTTEKLEQNVNVENKEDQQNEATNLETNDHIIDLTTALSSTRISTDSNTCINQRKKPKAESFEIPFIDCDRQEQLPQTDDYCLIDISHMKFEHNFAPPSTFGQMFASKPKNNQLFVTGKSPTQKIPFKGKHRIERFAFDTKSPDDIVLASLNRFTRSQ